MTSTDIRTSPLTSSVWGIHLVSFLIRTCRSLMCSMGYKNISVKQLTLDTLVTKTPNLPRRVGCFKLSSAVCSSVCPYSRLPVGFSFLSPPTNTSQQISGQLSSFSPFILLTPRCTWLAQIFTGQWMDTITYYCSHNKGAKVMWLVFHLDYICPAPPPKRGLVNGLSSCQNVGLVTGRESHLCGRPSLVWQVAVTAVITSSQS